MTERGAQALSRDARQLCIGPSHLAWEGDELLLSVDERQAPWPRRLQAQLRLQPGALPARRFALDAASQHHWQPISPNARVTVSVTGAEGPWQGSAYLDCNQGSRPLAQDFIGWDWSRSSGPDFRPQVHYELQPRGRAPHMLALRLDANDQWQTLAAPPTRALPDSAWGLARCSPVDDQLRQLLTLEDGPFYSRSLMGAQAPGATPSGRHGVHERVDLRRFESRWVQALLPFRMPRRYGS